MNTLNLIDLKKIYIYLLGLAIHAFYFLVQYLQHNKY